VATLRQRFPTSKIALVGTSSGTVSVGNALQRDPALAEAFVLTSPVTVSHRGGGTLASLDVDGTKYRALVVSNQHDECVSSPAYASKHLAEHNHFDFVQVDSTDGRLMVELGEMLAYSCQAALRCHRRNAVAVEVPTTRQAASRCRSSSHRQPPLPAHSL